MRPIAPTKNRVDRSVGDSKPTGDLQRTHALSVERSHLAHVVWGQFRVGPQLLRLVLVVLVCRPNFQVARVAAWRVIAGVQHLASGWYRAVRQFIGNAVRAQLAPVFALNHAISVAVSGARPRPTGRWVGGLVVLVEALVHRCWRVVESRRALEGAEVTFSTRNRAGACDEGATTGAAESPRRADLRIAVAAFGAELEAARGAALLASESFGFRHTGFYHVMRVVK